MQSKARAYAGSVLVTAGVTALALLLRQHLEASDLTMLYLLGVVVVAISFGLGPTISAAVLSVLAFDFLFVQPHFTLRVSDPRYLVTFGVMLAVGVITGLLTASLREQREHARRMAEQARHTQSQIEVERARSAVLSSVSHDLRTPLTAITGAATTLRDDASGALDAATRRELADTIADEAQRLNRLIGNLLDVTRLESGALHVHKEWHSVEEVVGAALTRLGPEINGRAIHVSLERLPLVPMDDILFEQVVRNLVDNAIRHSGNGEPVSIQGRLEKNELWLEVSDSGKGLSPEEETRAFEKFYRGGSNRGGAGLGLAICRGIVEAHGGTIQAGNRASGGAVFTVRLPIEGSPPTIESEDTDKREAQP